MQIIGGTSAVEHKHTPVFVTSTCHLYDFHLFNKGNNRASECSISTLIQTNSEKIHSEGVDVNHCPYLCTVK